MNNPPCYNCQKRTVTPNCHCNCPDYLAFDEERQKIRRERRECLASLPAFRKNPGSGLPRALRPQTYDGGGDS